MNTVTRTLSCLLLLAATASLPISAAPADAAKRPMKFMDVLDQRSASSSAVSPDGKWMLYALSVPDWKAARSYTDIFLVSTEQGVASTRQMTFTKDKNETSPRWSRDGRFFVFLSNREGSAAASGAGSSASTSAAGAAGGGAGGGAGSQIYLMRPDGGEARKITEAREGVGAFAFSKDGKWLVFSSGRDAEQQLWSFNVATIETEPAKQLTRHATPVGSWQFAPDSQRIYFLAPDEVDKANKERKEKRFDVRIRNEATSRQHLWAFDLAAKKETRLTTGADYSVSGVTVSKDSKWLGFSGIPDNRYFRTITDASGYADLYLLDVASGKIERLTENKEISESRLSFSPDSQWLAFSASDDFQFFRNGRVYLRRVADTGGQWRKLGDGFDGDLSIDFWSNDGQQIYFNEGLRATTQLCALSIATGKAAPVTRLQGVLAVSQDEETQHLTLLYSDPTTPPTIYTVASLDKIADRSSWRALTETNPQVRKIALGQVQTIEWKSTDGKMIEGILTLPPDYEKGRRCPLIVQIHGGPQSADTLRFSATYGTYSHVFAGAGYATFQPNYRGSSNYGERHKMEIGGDYFRQAYEDIMAGVDHLIAQGFVDGDKMGVMGWSAGGHWSNWILTHTDRFKAISSGAGAVNWISMYAQSDTQRVREFYYGGRPPYEDFAKYWDVSPLKFIKNAKTPTLIHVVDGDPRVPRPQSDELHMALKKLGVPTELFVYPGSTHGITEPRNQLVKMTAEFHWFEKYVRGQDGWFDWNDLLATLKDDPATAKTEAGSTKGSPE